MFDSTGGVGLLDAPDDDGFVVEPGPGQPWSSYAPDGLLAMLLDQQCCAPGGFEQVERIGAWDKVISWAQAQQLREITSFTARCQTTAQADAAARGAARAAGEPVGPEVAFCDGVEQAAAEVALILRVAPVTAAGRVDEAITLAERHPTALTALADGELTLTKVRIIAEQTTHLPDTQAAAVERRVLARAARQTPGQLRASVRRAVLRADPDAVRRRHTAAVRERGVWLHELPDGMAMLSACLPAAEAVGVDAVLDHLARTTGDGDTDPGTGVADDRTLPARRADALVDLVCGPPGHPAAGSTAAGSRRGPLWRRRVAVQVRVTVPFTTLFGIDEQPSELAGYGPITAEQARELAAAGTWRRILTDPATGDPRDFATTTYRPPAALRDAITTAKPVCEHPGCRRPAMACDLDHHIPHHHSQQTTYDGTGPYCRRHHRLKQTPRWQVEHHPDGTVIWTTPTGHTYTHRPPPVAAPAPARPMPDPDDPPPF
ncbi:MAG: DUF222 domain-containing protein [Pseudonocardiaceae bacterium]